MKHSQHITLTTTALALAALLLGGGCTLPGVYHTNQRADETRQQAQTQPQGQVQAQTQARPEVSQPNITPPSRPSAAPAPAPKPPPPPAIAVNATPPPAPPPPPPPPPPAPAPVPAPVPAPTLASTPPPAPPPPPAPAATNNTPPAANPNGAATASQPLLDIVWRLTEIGQVATHEPNTPTTIILLDTKSNAMVGRSGDMRFRAKFETTATTLRLTQIATDRSNITPFETTLLNTFSQTTAWRITGHTLNLLNQAGVTLATFIVAGK